MYRGQTTNSRTDGGGLAAVFTTATQLHARSLGFT